MTKHMMCTLALGALMTGSMVAGAQDMTGGAGSTTTPSNPSQSGMQSSGMSSTADQDKQFVMQASLGDYTEITFSQLALQKSTNPSVKTYAQKMITDHQKLETEMKPGADKLGVTPATALDSQHQQLYDQMNQLSGADFDKQYMTAMLTDHQKTLAAFKQEESTTKDAQLKPVVKKGEKVVAQHTQMAEKMQTKMSGSASGM